MEKKLETTRLVAELEKASRKTEKNLWKDLAKRMDAPRRQNIVVNVGKLSKLAKKFKGKTLIVPGKILSEGDYTEKATIVAISASESAKKKISKTGKFVLLKDFIGQETKNTVIIK